MFAVSHILSCTYRILAFNRCTCYMVLTMYGQGSDPHRGDLLAPLYPRIVGYTAYLSCSSPFYLHLEH